MKSLSEAVDAFLDQVSSARRRLFALADLEAGVKAALGASAYLEAGEYRTLAEVLAGAVARGAVEPVRARGTNGRRPALHNWYRLLRDPPRERRLEGAELLHPRIDRTGARRARADAARVRALSDYLYANPRPEGRLAVPRNERSLELFGDEKFLEQRPSFLSGLGLTLADVHAFAPREPFFYRRVREPEQRALIVENLSAFESAARALADRGTWAWGARPDLLVYGEGKKILRSHEFLAEFPSMAHCDYFGDLDPVGIEILADLRDREGRVGPGEALYEGLLAREPLARPLETALPADLRDTLGRAFGGADSLAEKVWGLFQRGLWLPQEALGLEVLLRGP